MKGRRSTVEIRIEILENAKEKIKPQHLMRDANLAYRPMLDHIDKLKEKGLIEEIELDEIEYRRDKRTKINYQTTMMGSKVVTLFNSVKKSID